jgi:hypothetical protein
MKTLVTIGLMGAVALMVTAVLANSAYASTGLCRTCGNGNGNSGNGAGNTNANVDVTSNGGNTGNIHTGDTGGDNTGSFNHSGGQSTGSSAVGNNQGVSDAHIGCAIAC